MVVVNIITNGSTKEPGLEALLRELTYLCATGKFELVPRYITSQANRLPDHLSRAWQDKGHLQEFNKLKPPHWKRLEITEDLWHFSNNW